MYDLQFILIALLRDRHIFTLEQRDGTTIESCIVTDYDANRNVLTVQYYVVEEIRSIELSLVNIDKLLFDCFYSYKGFAARTFRIS